MGGRPPTPTQIKLITGNPGKKRLPENEAKPPLALPQCPSYLSPEAKKEWKRMGAKLVELGLMTKIDEAAFAAYCDCRATWVASGLQLMKFGNVVHSSVTETTNPDGSVTKTTGKPMMNPYLRIHRESHDQMVVMLREFGMTPAARSRVHAQAPQRVNKLDRYLKSA